LCCVCRTSGAVHSTTTLWAEGDLKPENHAERSPASAITCVLVPNPPGDEPIAEKDLKALFLHQLKDTYFAENAILKALPQMAEAAASEELRGAFAVHLKETEGQVRRLEQIFQMVGEKPEGIPCNAIQGIIEEGQEILQEFSDGEALDAGLIAAAQAVEHYEIARYGTLLAWGKQLGLSEAQGLIEETLVEEENTDQVLSELAEDAINPAAAE